MALRSGSLATRLDTLGRRVEIVVAFTPAVAVDADPIAAVARDRDDLV